MMIRGEMSGAAPLASGSAAILLGAVLVWPAAANADELASHRAVYELTLARSQGNSAPVAARGRILYDFSGSACEGYKLEFRQVSELNNGEGQVTLTDLRTNTWEAADAKDYQFKSQNYLNNRLKERVDGEAVRDSSEVAVKLSEPKETKLDLDHTIVFPTEHIRRIIAAARGGKTILQFPVYDGTESGDKVYNTLTVIGRPVPPDAPAPADAAAGQQALMGLMRWPVTVSYFDQTGKNSEQLPAYAISFELYENGISRALLLDYNDFAIKGELSRLEIRDSKACP
jgi:hypothetical protein